LLHIPDGDQKTAERKIIVYKSTVSPDGLKLIAEKMKDELFIKRFSKPRPEDIQLVSIDRRYESYHLVNAKYSANICRNRIYILDVDEETEGVKISGKKLNPETVFGPNEEPRKVIKLEAEEFFTYEKQSYMVFDQDDREIPLDQVPTAPSEEKPEEIVERFCKEAANAEVSHRGVKGMLKNGIAERVLEGDKIEDENLQIFEDAVIYSPVFEILFRNAKTGEEKKVKVAGITRTPKNVGENKNAE
jgi:hypothetical protein